MVIGIEMGVNGQKEEGQRAQRWGDGSVVLQHGRENLSLIPRTHIKKPDVGTQACNLATVKAAACRSVGPQAISLP